MKKNYKVKLTIISENPNKECVSKFTQDIIVEKKSSVFKKIATGICFEKQTISRYDLGKEFNRSVDSEDIIAYYRNGIDTKFVKAIKNFGCYFLIEPSFFSDQNPLVTSKEVEQYLKDFNTSTFAHYLKERDQKTNVKDIKKLIKKYRRKGVL